MSGMSARRSRCQLMTASLSARFHVVGGGISGLAAAWELSASEGVQVTVHEASYRWGGKVHTSPFAGHPVDEGADAFLLKQELDETRLLDAVRGLLATA